MIRRKLDETPAFQKAAGEHEVLRIPLAELLRDHWANLLRVACGALASTVSTIFAVYALAFAVKTVGLDDTTMLWVLIVSNVVAMGAIPAWAKVADRIGRKPVFLFGALGSGALMFAYLAAIASGKYVLIFVAAIFMSGVVYSAQNGIWPALFTEMFPTRVRLSGVAIGTQIGFAIGGVGPTIATAIAGNGTDGWVPVAAHGARLQHPGRDRRSDESRDIRHTATRARRPATRTSGSPRRRPRLPRAKQSGRQLAEEDRGLARSQRDRIRAETGRA